jgi:integrase
MIRQLIKGMRKRFKVKPYKWSRLQWVVDGSINGKRVRKFFATKQEADSWCTMKNTELFNKGVEGAMYDTSLRIMAQEGAEKLKPFDKTIADAVDHYHRYLEANQRSCRPARCVDELLKAKRADGKSKRYLNDLAYRLVRFAMAFPNQMIATITTAQIDDWLRSLNLSPQSRKNYRRVVHTLFEFAITRGYAVQNPVEKTAKVDVPAKEPGILTVQQTARLLESASPDVLPYVAIGAFAGLRRAELERLDWSEVHFDDDLIEVKALKSKTAMRRFVTLQPNLREWLLPVRKHRGKVTPDDFQDQFDAAREAAGITDWPDNALRHSFASYHLAHFGDPNKLALEMGHTNVQTTYSHYRQLVRPKEAARYWNVRPEKDAKVVHYTGA